MVVFEFPAFKPIVHSIGSFELSPNGCGILLSADGHRKVTCMVCAVAVVCFYC